MNEPVLLRQVRLKPRHKTTGKTRHYRNGVALPPPIQLKIVQYSEDPGYYLFYCDDSGVELTDTYHETIESAIRQAEFEFQVTPEEWE